MFYVNHSNQVIFPTLQLLHTNNDLNICYYLNDFELSLKNSVQDLFLRKNINSNVITDQN